MEVNLKFQFKITSAFSLMELMTTMVIVGVISAVAAPAYKEYVKSVKMAEAYVLIDAIQIKQATHFRDVGYFVPFSYTQDGYLNNSSKKTLVFETGFEFLDENAPQYQFIEAFYKPMTNILPENAASYFEFNVMGMAFNQAGLLKTVNFSYDSNTGITSYGTGTAPGATGMSVSFSTGEYQSCGTNLTFDDMGLSGSRSNLHFSFVNAGMSINSDQCLVILQNMKAVNNEISRGPFLAMNLDKEVRDKSREDDSEEEEDGDEEGRDEGDGEPSEEEAKKRHDECIQACQGDAECEEACTENPEEDKQ